MVRYPLNGRPTAFFRGDWFVGKGVACARIRIGPGPKDKVEVFTTHVGNVFQKSRIKKTNNIIIAPCPLRTRTERFLYMP